MNILLYTVIYASFLIFIVACIIRALQYSRTPIHLRWELYPVDPTKPLQSLGRAQGLDSRSTFSERPMGIQPQTMVPFLSLPLWSILVNNDGVFISTERSSFHLCPCPGERIVLEQHSITLRFYRHSRTVSKHPRRFWTSGTQIVRSPA